MEPHQTKGVASNEASPETKKDFAKLFGGKAALPEEPGHERAKAHALMLESLARSGITDAKIIADNFEARSAREMLAISGINAPAYLEKFRDIDGNLIEQHPRYRFL